MPTESETAAELAALQAALAGEHAAVWGYGVLGPRAGSSSAEALALSTYAAHRELRDQLAARIQALAEEPVAAEPSYQLPFAVTDQKTARALAIRLEERTANLYGDLVAAATTPTLRAEAASALAGAEIRRIEWGGTPLAFPGIPERRTTPPSTSTPPPTSPPPSR